MCEDENWDCGTGCYWSIVYILFTKSNQDVTLFTRTAKQSEELNITGITCIRDEGCETVFPSVLPIESMPKQKLDFIFIAVKQYHITTYYLCAGRIIINLFAKRNVAFACYAENRE